MSDAKLAEIRDAKKRQGLVFAMGVGAACIPIFCQVLMGIVIVFAGRQDFPKSDPTIKDLHFWDVQMVLLCAAIAGNTLVDFGKHVIDHTGSKACYCVQGRGRGAALFNHISSFFGDVVGDGCAVYDGHPHVGLGRYRSGRCLCC